MLNMEYSAITVLCRKITARYTYVCFLDVKKAETFENITLKKQDRFRVEGHVSGCTCIAIRIVSRHPYRDTHVSRYVSYRDPVSRYVSYRELVDDTHP